MNISSPESGALLARIERPGAGPCLAAIRNGAVVDVTSKSAPTCRDICELPDPSDFLNGLEGKRIGTVEEVFANSVESDAKPDGPRFLSPCDLQAIKACGVTFVGSMIERVIEERAEGDPGTAKEIRSRIGSKVGMRLDNVVPGSEEAGKIKQVLVEEGLWSQYLEVGIGPYAEVFTKSAPLSSVGPGARIGIHPDSRWSNPEPELVLIINSAGKIVGASLGNDVNLRDFEGRSALLLGRAKDNNASCALGPFIRFFDAGFDIGALRKMKIDMLIEGPDGFRLEERSNMSEISRDLLDLAGQTLNENHAYPDGLALFCGTPFAPVEDRDAPGGGFTHHIGDVVTISAPEIGALSNTVALCADCERWNFAASHLMKNLARRNLI